MHRGVCNHSLVLKKRLLSHRRALTGSESSRQIGRSVSVHKISRCILPLRCTLPLLCFLRLLSSSVHREKCSNLSTVHWFHSACTSVSMFTINADNCLFCARVSVFTSGSVSTSGLCSNRLQPRHQIHHRLVTFIL